MDRETRHGIKHDKFVDEVEHFYDDVRNNSQKVVIGVVAALVVIGIGIGIWGYGARQEKKAQEKLGAAIQTWSEQVGDAPPQPGQKPAKFKTNADRIAAAEPMFKEVAEKFSGTDASQIASLYLAQIALGRGESAKALPLFEAFVKKCPDSILAGGAQMSIYELKIADDVKVAIPDLEKALQDEKALLPKDTLLNLLAQAYERIGDSQKSIEIYRRIATEYPESNYAAEAQQKISRG